MNPPTLHSTKKQKKQKAKAKKEKKQTARGTTAFYARQRITHSYTHSQTKESMHSPSHTLSPVAAGAPTPAPHPRRVRWKEFPGRRASHRELSLRK